MGLIEKGNLFHLMALNTMFPIQSATTCNNSQALIHISLLLLSDIPMT
jgi:hypothetical protein